MDKGRKVCPLDTDDVSVLCCEDKCAWWDSLSGRCCIAAGADAIKVSKTGEVFSTVTENGGVYQPVYTAQGLPGAVFQITAAEDVCTPDGTLRYSAGEVVDTLTTGAAGTAESKSL